MGSIVNRRKSTVGVLIITSLMSVVLFGVFEKQTMNLQAFAGGLEFEKQAPSRVPSARKAYSSDNFALDSVNVILTKKATMEFQNYTSFDFSDVNAVEVSDLTSNTVDYVHQKIESRNLSKSSVLVNRTTSDSELPVDIDEFQRILTLTVKTKSRQNIYDTIDLLNQRDDVFIAEPNFIIEPLTSPGFTSSWGTDLKNLIGWDSLASFQLNAPQINVGIIDSGIESEHTQLNDRMHWGNPHNATTTWHRDFTTGISNGVAVELPKDPRTNALGTIVGHGTQVAGIVSAIHWNAKLVSLRVFPANAGAQIAWIANAVNYAQSRGISILNYSGTGYGSSSVMATALNSYTGLFVTAAGNNGQNRDADTEWGNAGTQARTMVVGAHDNTGLRSVWNSDTRRADSAGNALHQSSSFGSNRVHIYAPGAGPGSIWAPSPIGTNFRNFNGTSSASPFVAGTAALISSLRPGMSLSDIRMLIINNGIDANITVPVWDAAGDNITGHVNATVRRLSAHRAVVAAFVEPISTTGDATIRMRTGVNLPQATNLIIPDFINRQAVVAIGNSGFANQSGMSQISIPTSVTTIGSNAFSNTNNAIILLLGRTETPSTFNINWNSSGNPVYLNGSVCYHSTSTLKSITSTQHGIYCNICKTATNVANHLYTSNYVWFNYKQHRSVCICGGFKYVGHIVSSSDPGYPYKTCLHCGGPVETGFVQQRVISEILVDKNHSSVQMHFGNGSYILSNGVVVISDEDLYEFYSGTLEIPCIGCEDQELHHHNE